MTDALINARVHTEWTCRFGVLAAKALLEAGDTAKSTATVQRLYAFVQRPVDVDFIARLQLSLSVGVDMLLSLDPPCGVGLAAQARVRDLQMGVASKRRSPADAIQTLCGVYEELKSVKGVGNEDQMNHSSWDDAIDIRRREDALFGVYRVGMAVVAIVTTTAHGGPEATDLARACAASCIAASGANAVNTAGSALQCMLALALTDHGLEHALLKSAVDARVDVVRQLSELARRAQDETATDVVQDIACALWQASHPLLQKNLRTHVQRPFEQCLAALEASDVAAYAVRAAMHVELARIYADQGLLALVASSVDRAEQMDRGGVHTEVLALLRGHVDAVSALDAGVDPDGVGGAEVQLEACMEARDPVAVRHALVAAVQKLTPTFADLSVQAQHVLRGNDTDALAHVTYAQFLNRTKTDAIAYGAAHGDAGPRVLRAWCTAVRVARGSKLWDLGFACAHYATALGNHVVPTDTSAADTHGATDSNGVGVNIVRELAEVWLQLGELTVQNLRVLRGVFGTPFEAPTDFASACGAEATDAYVGVIGNLSSDAADAFTHAAAVGDTIQESWIAINAAVYLWNYTSKLPPSVRCAFLHPHFVRLHGRLAAYIAAQPDSAGAKLRVVDARCCATIAQALLESDYASAPNATPPVGATEGGCVGALALCDAAIATVADVSCADVVDLMRIKVECMHRLQHELTADLPDPAIRAIFLTEVFCHAHTGHAPTASDVVAAVLATPTARGPRSSAGARTLAGTQPGATMPRALLMQLLARVCLRCMARGDVDATTAPAERILHLARGLSALRHRRVHTASETTHVVGVAHYCLARGWAERAEQGARPDTRRECLRHSVDHYGRACGGGADVLACVVKAAWNLGVAHAAFVDELAGLFQRVLEACADLDGKHCRSPRMPSERVGLYALTVEGLARRARWQDALDVVAAAYACLPRSATQTLDRYKIVCKAKLGLPIQRDVAQLDGQDPTVASSVWMVLGRAETDVRKSYAARVRAVEVLSTDGAHAVDRARALVALAEWLSTTPGTALLDTPERALLAAVDVLADAAEAEDGVVADREDHDVTDVRNETFAALELQFTAAVMLSQCSVDGTDRVRHGLVALYRLQQLWAHTLATAAAAVAAARKARAAEATPVDGKKKKKTGASADDTSSAHIAVPASDTEWAHFDVCTVVEGLTGDGVVSILRPYDPHLVGHYAHMLAAGLRAAGRFGACALPLLTATVVHSAHGVAPHAGLHRMAGLRFTTWHARAFSGTPPPPTLLPGPLDDTESVHAASAQRLLFDRLPTPPPTQGDTDRAHGGTRTRIFPPPRWQVWADEAALLFEHGMVEESRRCLAEAQAAASVFHDAWALARVHVVRARIAGVLDHPAQALAALVAAVGARTVVADVAFWVDVVHHAVDQLRRLATVGGTTLAAAMCTRLGALVDEQEARGALPRHSARYVRAKLALCRVQCATAPEDADGGSVAALADELWATGVCEEYFHVALNMVQAQAAGISCDDAHFRERATRCLTLLDTVETRIAPFVPADAAAVYTPLADVYAQLVVCRCTVALEGHVLHCREEREEIKRAARGRTVEEMIRAYVADDEPTPAAHAWHRFLRTAGDTLTARITALRRRCRLPRATSARLSLLLGEALHHAAVLKLERAHGPSTCVWDALVRTADDVSSSAQVAAGAPGADVANVHAGAQPNTMGGAEESGLTAFVRSPQTTDAVAVKRHRHESTVPLACDMLRQALVVLSEAVTVAVASGDVGIAGAAALAVAECVGVTTPAASASAARFLALHQSCRAVQALRTLRRQSLGHGACTAQQAAGNYSRARGDVREEDTAPAGNGEAALQIDADALDQHAQLPDGVRALVLQHSPDQQHLYGAVLHRGMEAAAGAVCCRVQAQGGAWAALQTAMRVFRRARAQFCCVDSTTAQGNSASNASGAAANTNRAAAGAVAETGDGGDTIDAAAGAGACRTVACGADGDGSEGTDVDVAPALAAADAALCDVRTALWAYVGAAVGVLLPALVSGSGSDGAVHVVLLVDDRLFEFPLEVLDCFRDPGIKSVTRDFSLNVLAGRLALGVSESDAPPNAKGKGKLGKGAGAALVPVPVAGAELAYVVDPTDAASRTAVQPDGRARLPCNPCVAQFETATQAFPGRSAWRGVAGGGAVLGVRHVHDTVQHRTGVVFYGPDTLLSALGGGATGALTLAPGAVALFADRIVPDAQRTPVVGGPCDVAGHSRRMAALLTVRGARGVVFHQWDCRPAEAVARLQALAPLVTGDDAGLGHALQRLRMPADFFGAPAAEGKGGRKTSAKKSASTGKKSAGVPVEAAAPHKDIPPRHPDTDIADRFNTVMIGLPHVVLTP